MFPNLFGGIFDTDTTTVITVLDFLLCVACALAIGLIVAGCYMYRTRYTKGFVATLALLPAVVCVVIMMVNGNVGAGVAVAGAFSLVRFRSVPGSAKEIGAIFLAMGTGLVVGMGYLGYAFLFAIVLGGGLCGVLGMLLGVPVFAVVYSLVKQFVDMRLRKKGLSTKAYDYRSEK